VQADLVGLSHTLFCSLLPAKMLTKKQNCFFRQRFFVSCANKKGLI